MVIGYRRIIENISFSIFLILIFDGRSVGFVGWKYYFRIRRTLEYLWMYYQYITISTRSRFHAVSLRFHAHTRIIWDHLRPSETTETIWDMTCHISAVWYPFDLISIQEINLETKFRPKYFPTDKNWNCRLFLNRGCWDQWSQQPFSRENNIFEISYLSQSLSVWLDIDTDENAHRSPSKAIFVLPKNMNYVML